MLSNSSRVTLMSHTDHSAQRHPKSNTPKDMETLGARGNTRHGDKSLTKGDDQNAVDLFNKSKKIKIICIKKPT